MTETTASEPAAADTSASASDVTLKPLSLQSVRTEQEALFMRPTRRQSKAPSMKLFSYQEEAQAAPVVLDAEETSHDVMMRNYSFDKFREAMMSGSPKSILLGEEENSDTHWRATGHTRAAYERHVQPLERILDNEDA